MVDMAIVNVVYKPTYNWGTALYNGGTPLSLDGLYWKTLLK